MTPTRPASPRRIAVVGSGVAGLVAAHVLSRTDEVTLLEADTRLGGHAHTHHLEIDSAEMDVDSGFIVHNRRTYPTLLRLFDELRIDTCDTEMSMSIRDDALGLEYRGGAGPRGMFPSRRAALSPGHVGVLASVPRFHRAARTLLRDSDGEAGDLTLREFLDRHRFSERFRRTFAVPLVSAVWSTEPAHALDYPAEFLFRFLDHHGMLTVTGSPTWRTVVGGSRRYVDAVAAGLHEVRTGSPVRGIREIGLEDHDLVAEGRKRADGDGGSSGAVELDAGRGPERFDAVVLACHSDQALAALAEPSALRSEVLGALPYQRNRMLLHTDTAVLPRAPHARASWNVVSPAPDAPADTPVTVTYDMTRLQHLPSPRGTRVLVTLGGEHLVDPSRVLASADYAHPLYTRRSVAARGRLPEIDSGRIVFAGAYHGWGFHEDGALSGLRAAERLGGAWPASGSGSSSAGGPDSGSAGGSGGGSQTAGEAP